MARFTAWPADGAAAVEQAVAHCRVTDIRLLYLVLAPTARAAADAARTAGAWLADAKCTYELPLNDGIPDPVPDFPLVLVTTLTSALRDLARASGEYSRFRLDPRIGWPAYCALYDQWLRKLLVRQQVWQYPLTGVPEGLLALDNGSSTAHIELLAVTATARRQGLGRALVQHACQQARQRGCQSVRVTTQGQNLPARHLYEQCGFQLRSLDHYYPLWF